MKKRIIVVLVICLLVISGFVQFTRLLFRDMNHCKEGDILEYLKKDGKIYRECGTESVTKRYRDVEGDKIIEKIEVIKEGESHIEVFEKNWADGDNIGSYWLLWLVASMVCLMIPLSYFSKKLQSHQNKKEQKRISK